MWRGGGGGFEERGGCGFVSHSKGGSKGVFDGANDVNARQKGTLGGSGRAQPRVHRDGNEKRGV